MHVIARVLALLVAAALHVVAPASPLPGTKAFRTCGGSGQPFPQFAAAASSSGVWVACREQGRVLHVSASGAVRARIAAPSVVSIASGPEGTWAVARDEGRLYRVTARRATAVATFPEETPYVFTAGGSVWVVVGAAGLVRVDPRQPTRQTQVAVGDGPSDVVSDGRRAWVICHRDHTLWRIDLASGAVRQLTTLPGDTPERLALARGKLWITGRGTDLMRVDPETGHVERTIEIGVGGIDLAATGRDLWVAAANAANDRLGLPVLAQLHRIDPVTGAIRATLRPKRQTYAGGLSAAGGTLWLEDPVAGLLLRR
jgi:streptogramin lyase